VPMFPGVPVAVVLLAQSVSAAPAGSQTAPDKSITPSKSPASVNAREDCSPNAPSADQRSIVICAQRPNGYRLNPDVMEARNARAAADAHLAALGCALNTAALPATRSAVPSSSLMFFGIAFDGTMG